MALGSRDDGAGLVVGGIMKTINFRNANGKIESGNIMTTGGKVAAQLDFETELPDPCSFDTAERWSFFRFWPVAVRHHHSAKRWAPFNFIESIGDNSLLIKQPGGVMREFKFEDVIICTKGVARIREKFVARELRMQREQKKELKKIDRKLQSALEKEKQDREYLEKKTLREAEARKPVDLGISEEALREFESLKQAAKQAKADEEAAEAMCVDAKSARWMAETLLVKFAERYNLGYADVSR